MNSLKNVEELKYLETTLTFKFYSERN